MAKETLMLLFSIMKLALNIIYSLVVFFVFFYVIDWLFDSDVANIMKMLMGGLALLFVIWRIKKFKTKNNQP